LFDFMRQFSFATLVTAHDGLPFATHLPFLVYPERGPNGTLVAHMARANPQWRSFANLETEMKEREALVIFQGAHTYISPSWYADPVSVPTWNYMVAHVYGVPRIIEDDEGVREALRALIDVHEGGFEEPWTMDLPEDYLRKMMGAIVAFEIPIARLEGKYKLSQNRSEGDKRRVIERLTASADPNAREVGAQMRTLAERSASASETLTPS
jgi:transcriptional regulator